MNCEQSQNLFDAFLDGELTGTLASEFAAHRLRCAECRRELALLEVAGQVVAADPDAPELDADFTERLLACATAPRVSWFQRHRRLVFVGGPLAAAACFALMLTAVGLSNAGQNGDGNVPERMVLPATDTVRSPEALLDRVEEALGHHPDDPRLQELADALRARGEEIVEGTKETANILENIGEEAIMEILGTLPIDGPPDVSGGNETVRDRQPSPTEDTHEPASTD